MTVISRGHTHHREAIKLLHSLWYEEKPSMTDLSIAVYCETNQREAVIFDSLPYIEQDLIRPDYETYAIALIDQEMQTSPMIQNQSLRKLEVPSFGKGNGGNSMNEYEYSQLVERDGGPRLNPIDFNQNTITSSPNALDTQTWGKSVQSAKVELEYERIRLINLELQAEFEPDLWRYHNSILDLHGNQPIQKALEERRSIVDAINAKRKYKQESQMGPKLCILERQWSELIAANRQLSQAIKQLEDEVNSLREATGETTDKTSLHEEIAFMDEDDD